VQTTLLGLAVAIIVALVAALVGPFFIDWGRYRTAFEAEATRLMGVPVHVHGRIDARLLPTPSLVLTGVEVGPQGAEPKLRARALAVEFALGALMRGEWRAAELRLDGPELSLGMDATGRIDVPRVSIGFDADQLSFERVTVEDGRIVLADAASGSRVTLDKLSFKGDVRSLFGPFRGEGAFVSAGQRYDYRVTGSRRGEDGGMRLRVGMDPVDRPLTVETDGTLWIEQGRPRYEGNLTLARPAGMVLSTGEAVATEPWRATSRVRATPTAALLEQLEFQYGPEDRALKLAGTAEFKFGARPRIDGVLSAVQVDLDRLLQSPDAVRRPPMKLLDGLSGSLLALTALPVPVKVGLGIDGVMLGGAALSAVRGDIEAKGDILDLTSFEFRAPGATQVRLSGRMALGARSAEFSGPANVESAEPNALLAWLEGRSETARIQSGALRLRGDLTLGAERIAVDRLKAEFDRRALEGRLAYVFATPQKPARLDAALSAAELDLDGVLAFAKGALAGASFERPRDIALSLDLGRTFYGGIEAKGAAANLRLDANGLRVERLAIADLGGASLNASGEIDTRAASPRGSLTLALEAQRLDGVAALATKLVPDAAATVRALAQRSGPTKLRARLDVAAAPAEGADAKTSAKVKIDGALAGIRVDLTGDARGDVDNPKGAEVRVDGRLDAEDGSSLAALIGLDRLASVDRRPARVTLSASGPADGDLRVDARFAGGGLDSSAAGTLRWADAKAVGTLDVLLAAADARLPRRDVATPLPVTLGARLAVDGDKLAFTALNGKVAGTPVKGRLALRLATPLHVDGRIEAGALDTGAVIASAVGMPVSSHRPWPPEPFTRGLFGAVEGRIEFVLDRAALADGIVARTLHGTARIEPTEIVVENIDGNLGGGRFTGEAKFRTAPSGLSAETRLSLANADMSAVMPRAAAGQVSGRVSIQWDAQGAGLSPAALIGALAGSGRVTVEDVQISGLDPKAFEASQHAVERGVGIDPIRIGDIVRTALDSGRLNVPWASGAFSVAGGRIVLTQVTAPAQGADTVISGSLDLGGQALDLRFALIGPAVADAPGGRRPELAIAFKGPLDSARRAIDVAPLVNWLTLRAVEQEAKRLEAAEREAKRAQAEEARRAAEEAKRVEQAKRVEEARRAEEAKRREAIENQRRASDTTASTSAAAPPPFDRAPELPPAIEVRPVPGRTESRARHAPIPALPGPMVITPAGQPQ
jgi:hypothetical protein